MTTTTNATTTVVVPFPATVPPLPAAAPGACLRPVDSRTARQWARDVQERRGVSYGLEVGVADGEGERGQVAFVGVSEEDHPDQWAFVAYPTEAGEWRLTDGDGELVATLATLRAALEVVCPTRAG